MGCGLLTCGVSLSLFSFNVGTFSNLFDPISALLINEIECGNFPGGPVAKTWGSQRRGPRFHPWLGN